MSQNLPENPWGRQDPRDGRPVPAPQYGQYIGNPTPHSRDESVPGRGDAPEPQRRRREIPRQPRTFSQGMRATWVIIALCVVVWLAQWVFSLTNSYSLASILGYAPVLTTSEPWRMLTSGFVHSMPSPLHLLLNMYTLYIFGRMLEPVLGPWRLTLLFLLSVLGGSVGVLLWGSPTVLVIGASGGVFGLFGALFVFLRHFKRDLKPLVVLIAINLVFGFVVGGVAWQAHIGGLLTGALVSLLMLPGLRKRG